MDWSGEWWVLILGPGLVILVVGILYFTRSRAFRFRSAAAQLGFIALQGLRPISDEEKKGLNLFSRGMDAKITNLFGDRVDSPSRLLFDFADSVGPSRPASAMTNQTVAAFRTTTDGIPDFRMTPARSIAELPSSASPQQISVDSHSDFGRRYSLRGENETAIRAFFNLPFVDRLTTADPEANWSIEKAAGWLLVYRHNVLFPPQAIPESWQTAQGIADLFLERH